MKANLGEFVSVPGFPIRIRVSTHAKIPAFVFAHEFGHFIDHSADALGSMFSRRTPAVEALIQAWLSSPTAARITKSVKDGEISYAYFKYLANLKEVWARAYSQWVATKAGGRLLKELKQEMADGFTAQWDDDEFEAIGAAVEALLREKGMLR
jgi:hypothetical protein